MPLDERLGFSGAGPCEVAELYRDRPGVARLRLLLPRHPGLLPYAPRQRTGSMRHLVVREGRNTGDLMLNVISFMTTMPPQ